MQKVLQFFTLFLLLGFNIQIASALTAPEITCITTAPNGDITIHWNTVNDPNGEFDSYDLFGDGGGFFNTYPNINTNSATITNPGAGTVDGYYVTVNSNIPGAPPLSSDTLKNIYLNLNNPGNGEAILQWNQPHANQLSSFSDYFHIYKEFPAGTWTLIDSVLYNTTIYSDTINVCEEFLSYQIILPTSYCNFTSNSIGDIFEDKIVPSIPVITNVNIDTLTNEITVSWDVNSQTDTYGYVVYQTDLAGNLVEIDTVWGRPNTTFTHSENLADGPFEYSIAAFDSCFTTNVPPTYQTSAKASPHTTNQLTSSIDKCNSLVNLTWTGYLGFDSIVESKIFASVNNGSWQEIGQSTTNSYSTNINFGDEMVIVVQTISEQGITSFSNKDTVNLSAGNGPGISYLSVATVEGENTIIKHRIINGDGVKSIQLERLNSTSQNFVKIDESTIGNDAEIIFTDANVDVMDSSYTYRTVTIDTCNQISQISNLGTSIHLKVITKDDTEQHTLQWTPYENFIGTISSYRVYRSIEGVFDTIPLAVLPYNVRTYTDKATPFAKSKEGRVCYLVEAVEASNAYGLQETSRSNIACGVIEPLIFIPNAFTVGGKNPIFKPETRHRQLNDYLFEIYDRYGRVIFSTANPEEGWNGKLKHQSRNAEEGVYVYRLSLKNGNGIQVIRHGHVTLLDYSGVK